MENTGFTLTLRDVLDMPVFQKAKVVAGQNGLHRKVRWVHILEVSNFETLLHGGEMILSTGVGLQWSVSSKTSFLHKLIEHGASCLCLELGHYFDSVPKEMIEAANSYNFPLIVFDETVRFVDITQTLHSLIINRHYKMLQDLEVISRELNRSTLTAHATSSILKLLQKNIQTQILYLPSEGKPQCIPGMGDIERNELIAFVDEQQATQEERKTSDGPLRFTYKDRTVLWQPVGAMGQIWANLALIFHNREPEEFDMLVLDRVSVSLAQNLLRKRYIEERELHSENVWVDDLIHNRIRSEDQMKHLLGSQLKDLTHVHYRVCLFEIENTPEMDAVEDEPDTIRLHTALVIRSLFQKHGFHPFLSLTGHQIIVVAVDLHTRSSEKDRLARLFDSLNTVAGDGKMGLLKLVVGVGRRYTKFTDTHQSYEEARQVLKAVRFHEQSGTYFYEDIGISRLLMNVDPHVIESFIEDYIGPIIEHDKAKGSELLQTLKVYLEHDGSKQISAQKLFIVRQTLYHRLEKIKELLGEDFMSSERRLSIEIAIRASQQAFFD